MIHQVEDLGAELQVALLPELEALQQGTVEVVDAVAAHVGERRGEGADVILELVGGLGNPDYLLAQL